MSKRFFITSWLFMLIQLSLGQELFGSGDSIAVYFDEINDATKKHQKLWSKDLYGPILLVNPDTRQVYANVSDTAGLLLPSGKVFSGVLPNEVNIANTAVYWSGRSWSMVILPLPVNKQDRLNFLSHELFHVNQPSLGFKLFNIENNHLDTKEGRIYLRLELEALKKALQTPDKNERKMHLTNALTFRKYRYQIFPGADTTENLLELNEGIAEYTGSVISGRNKKRSVEHFIQSINLFLSYPTFVRSFAYQTIPIYGFLLDNIRKGWNREVTINMNLTNYFIQELDVSLPADIPKTTDVISNQYGIDKIASEENEREQKAKKIIDEYKNKFITQSHVELVFEQMNVSFDPRNIIPIEDKGTFYPNIRVTDNWGILTVEGGALMGTNWDKISVTIPLRNENKSVFGDGWTLELKDGYSLTKDESTGNYKLVKK